MKKLFLILISSLLLINCKDDDDVSNTETVANEQTYLGETHPVDFVRMFYFENELIIQGGTADEDHGFGISFPDGDLADLEGTYTLNTDDETYNTATNFHAGAVYYLDDSQYAQTGEATIEVDVANEKIKIDIELNVQGEMLTAHYEGSYN